MNIQSFDPGSSVAIAGSVSGPGLQAKRKHRQVNWSNRIIRKMHVYLKSQIRVNQLNSFTLRKFILYNWRQYVLHFTFRFTPKSPKGDFNFHSTLSVAERSRSILFTFHLKIESVPMLLQPRFIFNILRIPFLYPFPETRPMIHLLEVR